MNLTLLLFGLLLIGISNAVIYEILKNRVDNNLRQLIGSIVILPGIPIYWQISLVPENSSRFLEFYLPLIVTLFLVMMFGIRLFIFLKSRSAADHT